MTDISMRRYSTHEGPDAASSITVCLVKIKGSWKIKRK